MLHDLLQTSLSCVGHKKGGPWLPGCQSKGRCSRGRICRAHENGGPAGWPGARARALGFKVVCSQGETTAAQCTGQHRLVPVPGRKPRMVARFACLACFACLDQMHTTDHLFWVQVDAAGGFGCLFPTPLFPFPPVDRCGHTRVPPKSLGVVRVRPAQGSEAKICAPSYAGYPSSPYRCSKRFDM